MANEIFCLCWNAHQNSVWQAIESLLQSEILVDCTISAEGQAIKAHKIILCACSPYLESLLREHPDSHPIIILNGIPFSDLKNLTEFMYRGEISLKKKDLARFIKSAQALKIKGLSKELSEICSDLSTETKRNKSKADEDETRPSEKKKKNDGAEFKQPKVDSPNSECVDSDRDVAESLLVPKSELPSDPDQSEPERCTQLEEMEEYEPLPTNTSTSETEGPIPEENMEQTWEPEAGTSNGVNDTLPDISGEGKQDGNTGANDSRELDIKITPLPRDYSWFEEDFYLQDGQRDEVENEGGNGTVLKKIKNVNLTQQTKLLKKYKCHLCPAVYYKLSSLTTHRNRKHINRDKRPMTQSPCHVRENVNYGCDKCSEHFSKLALLKQHQTLNHSLDSSPYDTQLMWCCDTCFLKFSSEEELLSHKQHCPDKRSTTPDDKSTHGDEILFLCDICNEPCSNIVDLRSHRLIHLLPSGNETDGASKSEKVLSSCTKCGLLYSDFHTNCCPRAEAQSELVKIS